MVASPPISTDGPYPSAAALNLIREWKLVPAGGSLDGLDGQFTELMAFVRDLWDPEGQWHEEHGVWRLRTAGNPVNEDLYSALWANPLVSQLCWYANGRGGWSIWLLPSKDEP